MKILTKDLEGDALDWAVAKVWEPGGDEVRWLESRKAGLTPFFSRDWRFGGPLLEHCVSRGLLTEGLDQKYTGPRTTVKVTMTRWSTFNCGDTLLVAVCRCYIAFMLGDVVDVPQEVLDLAPVA